jgi:hypothetical protein
MKIINEQFQDQWFTLPKDLLIEYSERLGTVGIPLYGYLAASADELYSCTLPDSKLTDALSITTLELKETLRLLKDTRLVKYEPYGVTQTTYTLLWQPCPLEKELIPSPY